MADAEKPEPRWMRGRLTFHSETGTEGGFWAFQDENHITLAPPNYGVFGGTIVFDKGRPERRGKTEDEDVNVLKNGEWLPLPDPIQHDEDYYISSLFMGEPRGDRDADARLMERYGFTFKYADERLDEQYGPGNWTLEDDHTAVAPDGRRIYYGGTPRSGRPYGVSEGELTSAKVAWEDGAVEERLSDTLLVERWSYDGLHYLADGDHLRIFERADPTKLVWEGTINLIDRGLFKETAFGYWIHNDQEGWDREAWARMFIEGNPAELRKKGLD